MSRNISFIFIFVLIACQKQTIDNNGATKIVSNFSVDYWETNGDQSKLLTKATAKIPFITSSNSSTIIEVDSTEQYQSVEGFGYTLTEGTAYLMRQMNESVRVTLLQEIFGSQPGQMAVNYIRISLGASDLSTSVYTYNDMPVGQTDYDMLHFSLGKDTINLIPILKQVLAINPNIKIMASPWTAPSWMKDNNSSIGGTLRTNAYAAYANYFLKYIQLMKQEGIIIDAITIQNEPQNPYNNPSMVLSAAQTIDFIKYHLGPLFQNNNINTKIVVWDHNCDNPSYPIAILNDPAANAYINGTAFHLYAGDISALSYVHTMFPQKQLYFTEQWTGANGNFKDDLIWHMKNLMVGAMRNWSKNVLEWNLANDINYGPHTNGGCTTCKGAYTIQANDYVKNLSYYIVSHLSSFVPINSIRIGSTESGTLSTVAFLRPDGKKVLVVVNTSSQPINFSIKFNNQFANHNIAGSSTTTYLW